MLIAASLKRILERYNTSYSVLVYTHLANPKQVIVADMLGDSKGSILMVRPLNRPLDLRMLNQVLHRKLQILPEAQVRRIFHDCESGCVPAIGHLYGLQTVIDASICNLDKVSFNSGSSTSFVSMNRQEYLNLLGRYKMLNCTKPEREDMKFPIVTVSGKYNICDDYDKLPSNLQKLLAAVKSTSPEEVVKLLKSDSLLSELNTDLWRHAIESANIAEQICQKIGRDLNPSIAYLGALLQNFGLLLFSHLFPPEYRLLHKWLKINRRASIITLEQRLLVMGRALRVMRCGHAELGAGLLEHYGICEQLCVIVKQHHNEGYKGEFVAYVKIIQLTNQILRRQGLGDGEPTLNQQLLAELCLTSEQITVNIGDEK